MTDPIEQVITKLESIVARCRRDENRAGFFAAMYLAVTREIQRAIAADEFEDGPRMAQLDSVFAQRYIDAFEQRRAGVTPTQTWTVSFDGADRWRPIIVQQLLTGMNAHINLDLGIAAATVAPNEGLADLRRDFDMINAVLARMTQRFVDNVGAVSPWIGLLDRFGGQVDQRMIAFSIDVARAEAWRLASDLAPLDPAKWPAVINARDDFSADLGRVILHPGRLLSVGLFVVRAREPNDVNTVIDHLIAEARSI